MKVVAISSNFNGEPLAYSAFIIKDYDFSAIDEWFASVGDSLEVHGLAILTKKQLKEYLMEFDKPE